MTSAERALSRWFVKSLPDGLEDVVGDGLATWQQMKRSSTGSWSARQLILRSARWEIEVVVVRIDMVMLSCYRYGVDSYWMRPLPRRPGTPS